MRPRWITGRRPQTVGQTAVGTRLSVKVNATDRIWRAAKAEWETVWEIVTEEKFEPQPGKLWDCVTGTASASEIFLIVAEFGKLGKLEA